MKHEAGTDGRGWGLGILAVGGTLFLLASSLLQTGCKTSGADIRHALSPVTLSQENISYQDLYVERCDNCHDEMPDPAEPYCFSGVSAEDHLAIWEYERAMSKGESDYSGSGKALFEAKCVGCHDLPDPSQPGCFSVLTPEDVIPIHEYMEASRRGKEIFEEDCRSCHERVTSISHDLEYWSAHLCNADMHLSVQDEQRVLMYLSMHAR